MASAHHVVVLLALVAQVFAMEQCDEAITKKVLAKNQLSTGNLLGNFGEKKFWYVASGEGADSSVASVSVEFGAVSGDSVVSNFTSRDANNNVVSDLTNTWVESGDHLVSNGVTNVYFFKGSDNLMVQYRCANNGKSGSGSNFVIWALDALTQAQATQELAACEKEVASVSAVTWVTRSHP